MPIVRFIADEKITTAIYDLIEETKDELKIVTPYINLWGHLVDKIEKLKKSGATISVIARKEEDSKLVDVIKKMNELHIEVRVVENLHAKIYLNEKRCIVSSMNLYNFSASNSREIAVIIEDDTIISEINSYIDDLISKSDVVTKKASDRILEGSKSIIGAVSKIVNAVSKQDRDDSPKTSNNKGYSSKASAAKADGNGHCIRCNTKIKLNADYPFCAGCYEKWKVYKKPLYKEKFCHNCGKPGQTSMTKPLCATCYKKGNY